MGKERICRSWDPQKGRTGEAGQEGNAELSKIKVHDIHVKNIRKSMILYN